MSHDFLHEVEVLMSITSSSRVPDHCRAYALSFESEKVHTSTCGHQHDLGCDRCNIFRDAIEEIELVLESIKASDEDIDEMKYMIAQAKKNVHAWKTHTLRSINQDEAQTDIMENLDSNSVLVTLDWAMKFLPRKYRESQSIRLVWQTKNFMAHFCCYWKVHGQLQTLTFVHIFKKCTQDSPIVVAVIKDVVKQLKATFPEVKKVYLRQDAGCYHSAATLLAIQQISITHKVKMRIDFSDPQGGK